MPAPTPKPAYGKDPIHKYSLLAPKFWHGMRLSDWLGMLAKNRFALGPLGVSATLFITPTSMINSTCSAINDLVYGKKIERLELAEPPLFVLGHWRSGTTMLHEMLIRDPRHAYPNTYQCFAPHHFLHTAWWAKPITAWLLPKKRPMDNVATGWEKPQEDEFALCNLGLPTPYRTWAFPQHGPVHEDYLTLENLTDPQRQQWIDALRWFVKAVALKDNKRVILKSPPHTARVKTILQAFPDARFIHIARDPLTLFPSTMRLWKSMCDTQCLQVPKQQYDWMEEEVLNNFEQMYQAYERDHTLIPAGGLAELRYEDLVADPVGELRKTYEQLNLGDFSQVEPHLGSYLEQQSGYQTNRYELPEEIEAKVRARWAGYFERYRY